MPTKKELAEAIRAAGDTEFNHWHLMSWKKSDLVDRYEKATKPAKRVKSRPLAVKDVAEVVRKRTSANVPPVDGTLPCTRCGEVKPVDQFYKSTKQAYAARGYSIWCVPCQKAQREEYVARKAQP